MMPCKSEAASLTLPALKYDFRNCRKCVQPDLNLIAEEIAKIVDTETKVELIPLKIATPPTSRRHQQRQQ